MSEEISNVAMLHSAMPNTVDLRQIGAHPDYWYPLAWSEELKAGKTLARRFAGEPCVGSPARDPGRGRTAATRARPFRQSRSRPSEAPKRRATTVCPSASPDSILPITTNRVS